MLLYIMRHGPAEDRAPNGRDFDRPLTPSGRELVRRMAVAFVEAHAGARFGAGASAPTSDAVIHAHPRVFSSPRVRARETAEILVETLLGIPPPGAAPAASSIEQTPPAGTPIPWALAAGARSSSSSFSGGPIEIRHELDGDKAIPLEFIAELAEAGRDAILIGHQPCVDELVRQLVESGHDSGFAGEPAHVGTPGYRRSPTPPPIAGFRTAMIVGLEGARVIAPNPRRWRLALILDPRRIVP